MAKKRKSGLCAILCTRDRQKGLATLTHVHKFALFEDAKPIAAIQDGFPFIATPSWDRWLDSVRDAYAHCIVREWLGRNERLEFVWLEMKNGIGPIPALSPDGWALNAER